MAALRAEPDEIAELAEKLPPVARRIVERRWLAEDRPPRLVELVDEIGVGILVLDRQERRAYREMVAELGDGVPHPVYEPEIDESTLEKMARRVREGEIRHIDVARALRIGTSRVRALLGPRTRMRQGRMVHGSRAFFEHGCRCEICSLSVSEALAHYDRGGEARTDIEPFDIAPCQESPRVYFAAGHHPPEAVLAFCARVGIDVDAVRHAWWRKQRARLWWTPERLDKCNPVTVAAKVFPYRAERTAKRDAWVRRWLSGDVEEEVLAAALGHGEEEAIADMGWCDADGFPMPTKQATHLGVEWSRMSPA